MSLSVHSKRKSSIYEPHSFQKLGFQQLSATKPIKHYSIHKNSINCTKSKKIPFLQRWKQKSFKKFFETIKKGFKTQVECRLKQGKKASHLTTKKKDGKLPNKISPLPAGTTKKGKTAKTHSEKRFFLFNEYQKQNSKTVFFLCFTNFSLAQMFIKFSDLWIIHLQAPHHPHKCVCQKFNIVFSLSLLTFLCGYFYTIKLLCGEKSPTNRMKKQKKTNDHYCYISPQWRHHKYLKRKTFAQTNIIEKFVRTY